MSRDLSEQQVFDLFDTSFSLGGNDQEGPKPEEEPTSAEEVDPQLAEKIAAILDRGP